MTSDDCRIPVWNLNNLSTTDDACIFDLEGSNHTSTMYTQSDSLYDYLTGFRLRPTLGNILLKTSSTGISRLCDVRASSNCCSHFKKFYNQADIETHHSFFANTICPSHDIQFSPEDFRYLLLRDYMKLRLWDYSMERELVMMIPVHGWLRGTLVKLCRNECMF